MKDKTLQYIKINENVLTFLGCGLLILGTFLKIPFYPVSFTMQTFVLFGMALHFPQKVALRSTLFFLGLATVGLSVYPWLYRASCLCQSLSGASFWHLDFSTFRFYQSCNHLLWSKTMNSIRHVIIYSGHQANPLFGPYAANIPKRVAMFEYLNRFRKMPWDVETVDGDKLVNRLQSLTPKHTLLVIPAGQSTRLDKVFSVAQCSFIKEYIENGAFGYFNCGSAYMVSQKRIFHDLCEESPDIRRPIIKYSQMPLFNGIAEGPLCPFPGKKYNVGFFSDAVQVTDGSTLKPMKGHFLIVGQTGIKLKVLLHH